MAPSNGMDLSPDLARACAELERRLRAGEAIGVETILERHGPLAEDADAVLELIYLEYWLREKLGQAPRADEFLARFPERATDLRDLFEVHLRLADSKPEDGTPGTGMPSADRFVTSFEHVRTLRQQRAGQGRLPAHTRIGNYELLSELGRGGMGVVYKARQLGLERTVALKMVRAGENASAADLRRFRSEAEAVAQLDHPSIVPIHEVGEHEGLPYFSMKWMEGGSLARRAAIKPAAGKKRVAGRHAGEQRAAAALMVKIARAVHHAHRHGILHRDLKPDNVLLDAAGEPHVMDFGLAKRLEEDSRLTQSGTIVGSPSYMAPEQAQARRDVTTAADVYGLGAILYQLLCGQPPFLGANVLETLKLVVETPPAPPRQLASDVDIDLETICLKCLEKNPAARYADAEALARDLERWLNGEVIEARPVGPFARGWRWCRRNALVASLLSVIFLALSAGIVVSWLFAADAREQAAESDRQTKLANAATEQAAALARKEAEAATKERTAREASERALRRLEVAEYAALNSLAYHHLKVGELTLGGRYLDRSEPHLRDWEAGYLRRVAEGRLRELPSASHSHSLAYSEDGARLTAHARGLVTTVWDMSEHRILHTYKGPGNPLIGGHVLSWNGRYSVAPINSPIDTKVRPQLWDVWNKVESFVFTGGGPGEFRSAAFTWDNRRIAWCGNKGSIRVWDLEAKKELSAWNVGTLMIEHPVFSPDSFTLAVATAGQIAPNPTKVISLIDVRTGKKTRTVREVTGFTTMAFSANGRWLAVGMRNTVIVFDTPTVRAIMEIPVRVSPQKLVFRPDSKALACAADGVYVWALPDSRVLFHLNDRKVGGTGLAFSPDGTHLATSADNSQKTLVWNVGPPRDPLRLTQPNERFAAAAFSPDGKALATFFFPDPKTGSFRANVTDTRLWQTTKTWRAAINQTCFAYRPDGKGFAVGSKTGPIHMVDVDGKVDFLLTGHTSYINDLVFSLDGKRLASGGDDKTVRFWDVAARKQTGLLRGNGSAIRRLAFRPDGKHLALATQDGRVRLVDCDGAAPVHDIQRGSKASCLDYHPRSDCLAIGYFDKTIELCHPEDGQVKATLKGHDGVIVAVKFHPDGRRLASLALDETVKIWDVATGQEVLSLEVLDFKKANNKGHSRLEFSPDGRRLVLGADGGVVLIWEAQPTRDEKLVPIVDQ